MSHGNIIVLESNGASDLIVIGVSNLTNDMNMKLYQTKLTNASIPWATTWIIIMHVLIEHSNRGLGRLSLKFNLYLDQSGSIDQRKASTW